MHEVALAYARFDTVAGTSMDAVSDLRTYDAYNSQLLGAPLRASSPSLGIVDSVNQIAKIFAENPTCSCGCGNPQTHIFWMDCDMSFPPDTVDRLMFTAMREDAAAVSALTFKYQQTEQDGLGGFLCEDRPVIMNWGEADNGDVGFMCRANYPENALIQCQATGMACVLIHRKVYEAIAEKFGPGGEHYPQDPALRQFMWGRHGGWHSPLPAPPDAAMDLFGPDISFWSRAALCDPSFMPFVHTGICTDHQKTTWRSHNTFVAQMGDAWKAGAPGAEYSTQSTRPPQPAPSPVQNRKQRRAAAKAKPQHQMDTPGIGGVPLPPPDLDTAG